jgi:DNA-binding PadR family transcriptional regulator
METIEDGYGDDVGEALEAVQDETARELLLGVDRRGKLREDQLEKYGDEDEVMDAFADLESAGLAIYQNEITDSGAAKSYEITFKGEQFLDAINYEIEGIDDPNGRYDGEIPDETAERLELAADPINRAVLEYLERSDQEVEFEELRMYTEQQGLEEPYRELRSAMTDLEDASMAWTRDDFEPGRGNVIQCGLYPAGEDIVHGMDAYDSDGAVQRPDTGAGRA